MADDAELCTCGYADGSFACKIRHLQINTGDAKAASDRAPKRDMKGIEVH